MKKYIFLTILLLLYGCSGSREAADLYQSGMKEFRAKKLAEAEKFFLLAVDKDSSLLNASLMLCKIYYYNGNFRSALEYADSILDKDSDHAVAMYWKARALVMSNNENLDEPVKLLVRSLEIDSHNIEARLLLGMIFEKKSQYREALHQYLAVIEEEDGVLSARGNLALLYRRMGLSDKSEAELVTAEKISELSGRGRERLKLIRNEMGASR